MRIALQHQLRVVARGSDLQPRALELDTLIVEMASLVERTVGEHIVVELDLASDGVMVHHDPTRVEQMLLNLVINARTAMPDGGRLRVAGMAAARLATS